MYCSSCGIVVAEGSTFCKHCGAKQDGAHGDELGKRIEMPTESLVWAMVTVFVVGLGATIGLMAVMKDALGSHPELIIAFSAVSFLTMISIESVFVWLMLRGGGGSRRGAEAARSAGRPTNEIRSAPEPMLLDPVPSVVEHTTRAFEPSYVEREPDAGPKPTR